MRKCSRLRGARRRSNARRPCRSERDLRVFLTQIERKLDDATRGEHAERLLLELIKSGHQAGVVGFAADAVELGQQGATITETLLRDSLQNEVVATFARRSKRRHRRLR